MPVAGVVDVAVGDVAAEAAVCEIKAFNSATNCASPPPSWWWWRMPWAGVAAPGVGGREASVEGAAFGSVGTAAVDVVAAELEVLVFCAFKESNRFLSKAIKACEI